MNETEMTTRELLERQLEEEINVKALELQSQIRRDIPGIRCHIFTTGYGATYGATVMLENAAGESVWAIFDLAHWQQVRTFLLEMNVLIQANKLEQELDLMAAELGEES